MTPEQLQLAVASLNPELSKKMVHWWAACTTVFRMLRQNGVMWVRMEAQPDMTYFDICKRPAAPAAMEMNPN